MKHRRRALISCIAILACLGRAGPVGARAHSVRAWTTIGPERGNIRVLLMDPLAPDTVYAGTLAVGGLSTSA
jgi:hypothetical protein